MNSLHSLAQEFQIPHSFLENYKTYVGITSRQKDKQVAVSAIDVFATQAYIKNADNKVYNDYDTAYAVAVQNIEVFQIITSLNQQPTQYSSWGIQLLRQIIFQLDKTDPLVYLNTLMANKIIPNHPIQQEIEFSKIYSFVHLCGFAQLLKPLQQRMQFPFLFGTQQISSFNPHSIDSSSLVLYQLAESSPILIIIKPDIVEIQKKIFSNHLKFLKEICIQLMFDATTQNKNLSFVSECLKFQPFKFQKIEDLVASILEGQYNYQDRYVKFLQILNIQQTLGFLIDPQFNIDFTIKQLKEISETTLVEDKPNNSLQQTQPKVNVFDTIIPTQEQQFTVRKTITH